MAFINAYLTEEEKEEFKKAKIHDPRFKLSKKDFLTPSIWTIDRENNIALICCGVANRDEHNKETFALIYKQLDNENLITFTLINRYFNDEDEKKLEKKYNVNLIEKWEVFECKIPKTLKSEITKDDVYRDLTDALSAYGVKGNPNRVSNVKAFLEIDGEVIE